MSLGERIKQARIAAGLSQEALGAAVGVSAMAISKYERGDMLPGSEVLLGLANALGVRTEYFFRQVALEISEADFRKHKHLAHGEQQRVMAQMRETVERWVALDNLSPTRWSKPFKLPDGLPETASDLEIIEDIAQIVRNAWGLGTQPICDLSDLLEHQGIKVFLLAYDAGKRWDGLVAKANGEPVIVVGADWPGDRQRFTMAHELGHLILEGRLAGPLAGDDETEAACHRFAGAFLMPAAKVAEAFGPKRNWIEPRELLTAKLEYGLSMGALIYRVRDLGILTKTNAGRLFGFFKKQGWHRQEPGPAVPQESPKGFEQAVFRSLGEELIGESRAAELLGISLEELIEERLLRDEV